MRWALQMAVLAALVFAFALQMPKSALFFNPAAVMNTTTPRAAFVVLDDAAYARLIRQVRSAGTLGASHGWNEGAMSLDPGAIALDDLPPTPPGLPLPEVFTASTAPAATESPRLTTSLQPESLAMPPQPPLPKKVTSAPAAKKRPDELLDLEGFESLKERK